MPPKYTLPGVYINEVARGSRYIAGVATAITAFIGRAGHGPVNDPITITSYGAYERIFGGLKRVCPMGFAVRDFFGSGGGKAVIIRLHKAALAAADDAGGHLDDNSFLGTGMEAAKQGLFALEKTDFFNLLVIPPYAAHFGGMPAADEQPTDITANLIAAALSYCEKRRAMMLLDGHSTWNNKQIAVNDFLNNIYPGTTSKNAALFFPRIMTANPLNQFQPEAYISGGAVAGIFARMDARRGVWKSPAGLETVLRGVAGLSVSLTNSENGELNQLGINCLRDFPGTGTIVWGSRTLEGSNRNASEWKYIAVRRTALFIEESLIRGTKWVIFEPNNELLWKQIRMSVEAFLHDLFRKGAFQGASSREAYFVKCDSGTTTQHDINNGIVNILVGVALLKPAEFLLISIRQTSGQVR